MSALSMYRGDAAAFRFTIVDEDGEPLDLDTVDLRFTVKRHDDDDDDDALIVRTSADGIDIDDPATGVCVIRLRASDTDDLPVPTSLVWDLQSTNVGDVEDVHTLLRGTLKVRADVSRTVP